MHRDAWKMLNGIDKMLDESELSNLTEFSRTLAGHCGCSSRRRSGRAALHRQRLHWLSITKSEWTIQIPEFMYRQISSSCEPGTRLLKVWNADEVFRKRMISSKSERKDKTEGKNKILIQPKTDPSKLRNCRRRNGQLCFASATARGGRAWATTVCRWNSRSIYQSKNKSKRCPPLQCN